MSGIFNGVQAKVQEKLSRQVPYIPCQAHRSNTVIEHSCEASIIISDLFDILENIYVFFSGSTKRYSVLSAELEVIENALKLKNLSKTRWTARADAIQAVWHSYEAIVSSLNQLATTTILPMKQRALAQGLQKKIKSFDLIVSLMFMKNIMYKTKNLTEKLQEEELNVSDAVDLIEATIASLQRLRDDTSNINDEIKAASAFAQKFDINSEEFYARHHRPRRAPRRVDDNAHTQEVQSMEGFYRREITAVLDVLITQYTSNMKVCLKTVQPLVDLLRPPFQKDTTIDSAIVTEVCHLFPRNSPEPCALAAEIDIFRTYANLQQTEAEFECTRDVSELCFKRRAIFPLTSKAYQLLLTAPVTVAKDERTFSKLGLIKTFHRSTMGDERLDSLVLLACEKDLTDSLCLNDIVKQWAGLKARRVNV
jgi:hypothetical protein